MDFLVHKFSDWLKASHIDHTLTKVKGGYILQFIDPDEDLKKLISSLFITIDTGEMVNHMAVRKPVNVFTSSGEGIIIQEKYWADILNTVQPVLREYVYNKLHNHLGTH